MKINEIVLIILLFFLGFWISANAKADTIKVMVIDTGVDNSHDEIKEHVVEKWNLNYVDKDSHGTAIASLVVKDTCSEVELISCRYYYPWSESVLKESNNCFKEALRRNVQFVNYSSTGIEPDEEERQAIKQLSDKGVVVVVAAGNEGRDLFKNGKCSGSFPACYMLPNVFVVQNLAEDGVLAKSSNKFNHPNGRFEYGINIPVLYPDNQYGMLSGTSPATAVYTNKLLKRKCWELNK